MVKPISVSVLPNLRIKVEFSDGTEGSVDLSELAGRGVFKAWEDEKFFAQVHAGPGRQIRWNDEIELCPDAIYLKLTGKTPEDLFPRRRAGREQVQEVSDNLRISGPISVDPLFDLRFDQGAVFVRTA